METKTKCKNLSSKEKILKVAQIGEVVSKIFYITAIVCAAVATVCTIAAPFVKVTDVPLGPTESAIAAGGAALYMFMLIDVWWNVKQIFKNIRVNQTPFNERVIHYLKKTAVAVILISIIPAFVGSLLLNLVVPESVIDFDFQYIGLGVGVLLFMLGLVFNYGIELQKKDDETL